MTSILSQLSQVSVPAALPVLLFLGKATLLLLMAIVISAALRRASAGVRHMVWVGALAAVIFLPGLSRWTPWHVAVLPISLGAVAGTQADWKPHRSSTPAASEESSAPAARSSRPYEQLALTGSQHVDPGSAAQSSHVKGTGATAQERTGIASATSESQAARASAVNQEAQGSVSETDLWLTLSALWMAGTLALLARLLLGMAAVRRIVRGARPLDTAEWTVPLWEVSDRLGLARAPRILYSDEVSMPFACGVVQPTVVLPVDAGDWSDDRRRAVLFHELAHVRRRDLFGHTLGRIACAIYWFHPLVWAAARRLRSESERACDDLVLTSGTRPSEYAHHLLEIVTGGRDACAPATALAMARRKEFEGRMLAILDPEQRRAAPGRLQAAALGIGLVALTLSVSAMAPAAEHRAASFVNGTRLAADSATARDTMRSRAAVLAETTAPPGEHRLAAAVPDTGEDANPRTIQRVVTSPVERSAERAVEEVAEEIAGARYSGLLSDRNNFAPRMDSYSLEEVRRAIRTSMRESLGESMRGGAASQHADSGTTDLLVKLLQSDSDAKVRRTAAWALAQRDERDTRAVTAALAAALAHDANGDVREMAAWGLGQNEDDTAVQALRDAVQHDADERVKTTAAWALGTIGDAASSVALDAAMADPSASVRSRAAWALGQIEPDKAPRGLVSALGDSSDKVRLAAAWALGQIEDPETLSAISQALSTEKDHDIREAELRALILLGEASEATLQKLLESPDPDVRLKVTRAIVGFRGLRPWPWPMPMPRPMP
jgi:beta-lactamase regulating signal transducer with metallopeptidase domain/HEAT repeat protein